MIRRRNVQISPFSRDHQQFIQQVPAGGSTLTIYGLIPGGQRVPAGA
jgi:hypothetical protein